MRIVATVDPVENWLRRRRHRHRWIHGNSDSRGELHKFRDRAHAHLSHHSPSVHFYTLLPGTEYCRNLFVESAKNDLFHDLALAWGKGRNTLINHAMNCAIPTLLGVLSYDEELLPEMVAGVRTHWDGLFQFGAPDGVVVNVSKNAIWTRKAALPESTNFARPSAKEAKELFDLSLTHTTVNFPNPKYVLADIESPGARDSEVDARDYYPPSAYRKPEPIFPKNFKLDIRKIVRDKIMTKIKSVFSDDD